MLDMNSPLMRLFFPIDDTHFSKMPRIGRDRRVRKRKRCRGRGPAPHKTNRLKARRKAKLKRRRA